jgi:hypothetical protein
MAGFENVKTSHLFDKTSFHDIVRKRMSGHIKQEKILFLCR